MIRGTYYLTQAGFKTNKIRQLILRRRLQILVHSYLYYKLDTSLISDAKWQDWANELVKLQLKYPKISKSCDYYQDFKDFNGSTGYYLPYCDPNIMRKGNQLLKINGVYK